MGRLRSVLVSLLALSVSAPVFGANLTGDADADGAVNSTDAALIQSRLYGLTDEFSISPLALADSDNDLDLKDLLLVAQAATGMTIVAGPGSQLTLSPPANFATDSGAGPIALIWGVYSDQIGVAENTDGLETSVSVIPGTLESYVNPTAPVVSGLVSGTDYHPINTTGASQGNTVRLSVPISDSSGAFLYNEISNMTVTVGPSVCGNAVPQPGEVCDDGPGGSCHDDCSGINVCGDGAIFEAEICDDGVLNGQWNQCNITCDSDCGPACSASFRYGDTSGQYLSRTRFLPNGNIALGGSYAGVLNFGGGNLTSGFFDDIYLTILQPDGTQVSAASYGAAFGYEVINEMAVAPNGNVHIAGYFSDASINFGGGAKATAGTYDGYLAVFDSSGVYQWDRTWGTTASDSIYSVAVDASNNVYIAGSSQGAINLGDGSLSNEGNFDGFLAKLDSTGDAIWTADGNSAGSDSFAGVDVDGSGWVAVTGNFQGTLDLAGAPLVSAGDYDIFVALYDSEGTPQWAVRFGAATREYDQGVRFGPDGSIYVGVRYFDDFDYGSGTLVNQGLTDAAILKLDRTGTVVAARALASASSDAINDLRVDRSGDVWASIGSTDAIDLGDGLQGGLGGYDFIVARYDANLNHLYSEVWGGAMREDARSLDIAPDGTLAVGGDFADTLDLGAGPHATAGSSDLVWGLFPPPGAGCYACGDGTIDPGETCDDPALDECAATCDEMCGDPSNVCGDGWVRCGEVCDAGADNGTCNACSADCTQTLACGDGTVDAGCGEACDEGADNGKGFGFCKADCSEVDLCGNGAPDGSEACDDGAANGTGDGFCLSDCSGVQSCGDGVVEGTEFCDDGADNGTGEGFCISDCSAVQSCGDAIANGTEPCDDGDDGNDNNDCLDGCVAPTCGDGFVWNLGAGTEICDDGDANDNNDCTNACQPAACGDGVLWDQGTGTEICDDGNPINQDDCLDTCVPASCGDGHTWSLGSGTEFCDDGPGEGDGLCLDDCSAIQWCGDLNVNGTEQCDLGIDNGNPALGCDLFCQNFCGNGVLDAPGEDCDPPDGVTCDDNCRWPACGDGIVNPPMETCDEGGSNGTFFSGCDPTCQPYCGNGVPDPFEDCDPPDGILCDDNCLNIFCGDGVVNPPVEGCDAGLGNGDPASGCDGACQPYCGNGIPDPYEDCDPPTPGVCDENCLNVFCGDGIVNSPDETCDDGVLNGAGAPFSLCDVNCQPFCGNFLPEFWEDCDPPDGFFCDENCLSINCGDGVVNPPVEECDEGFNNGAPGSGCDFGCLKTCGDGFIDPLEDCDPPDGVTCDEECRLGLCGDGVVNAPMEDCDLSGANGQPGSGCDVGCQATCGNNALEAWEDCDPPNDFTCDENCLTAVCGDSVVSSPMESCDEGVNNGDPASGCDWNCVSVCGNGFWDIGEDCDPPDGFGCDDNCLWANCGDGIVNEPIEECDEGILNGAPGSGCDPGCFNTCGNGFPEPGEDCDPPNGVDCDENCRFGFCGDGVVNSPFEECDSALGVCLGLGRSCSIEADCAPENFAMNLCVFSCDPSCELLCGNGVPDFGEDCDPPSWGVCDDYCQTPLCGDGVINPPMEECDLGAALNGAPGEACDLNCLNTCGNGVLDLPYEDCDPPDGVTCDDACQTAFCGDNIINAPMESCDEGDDNGDPAFGCDMFCQPFCGNGFTDFPFEDCDPPDGFGCDDNCMTGFCGDGQHNPPMEACDDGALNGAPGSDCDFSCQLTCGNLAFDPGEDCDPPDGFFCDDNCLMAICGDGIVNAPMEGCDEGFQNGNPAYGCDFSCQPFCGNFSIDPFEDCDPPGNGCDENCRNANCGDGLLNPPDEACDEGVSNGDPASGCDATCQPFCGNYMTDIGEDCDPPDGIFCDDQCRNAFCGDGVLNEPMERCDDGMYNGDPIRSDCDFSCNLFCGNGIIEMGEDCDPPSLLMGCDDNCRNDFCGDGLLNSPMEECDDGNLNSGDGCDPGCFLECGNGMFDPGESCDPPDGVTCDDQCRVPTCGDNVLNAPIEECDDGNLNPGDGCDSLCYLECGNGFLEPNEQCDPPDGVNCDANCRIASCGDKFFNPPMEECDAGPNNGMQFSGCDANCRSFCGNFVVDPWEGCEPPGVGMCDDQCRMVSCGDGFLNAPAEECDDGVNNGMAWISDCAVDCRPLCGNGNLDGPEQCDPPDGLFCDDRCRVAACGDGIVNEPMEACDGGLFPGTCTPGCQWFCGNGVTDGFVGEECDPPDGVFCSDECHLANCGNGRVESPLEQCDEGANNGWAGSGCDLSCRLTCGNGILDAGEACDPPDVVNCDENCNGVLCGNGVLNPPLETCDDGNLIPGDGCDPFCNLECGNTVIDAGEACEWPGEGGCSDACQLPVCPDTVTDSPYETCDDGNAISGDGCDMFCYEECGNGMVDAGETCDPPDPFGGCSFTCQTGGVCGDGTLDEPWEQCDDKNLLPDDGCDPFCMIECGDWIVGLNEACDPPGLNGCSDACQTAVCADGTLDSPIEECDDANALPGDGCDDFCYCECPSVIPQCNAVCP